MYNVCIYTTTGSYRSFNVKQYEYALERIEWYKNNYRFYKSHTLSYFDGYCWVEM